MDTLTRAKFLDRIEDLMKRTRGRELPGTFNPMIISDLFFEQSQQWEALARSQVEKVTRSVKIFLKRLISYIADASTCEILFQALIEPSLEHLVKDLNEKTADLLTPHQRGHPITYNHYFTETVQRVRDERRRAEFTRIIQDFFGIESLYSSGSQHYGNVDYRALLDAFMSW